MTHLYPPKCPIGRTLNLIGERWAIMILRDLMLIGPRKFSDFERAFPRLGVNTLSARLKALEESGLIARRLYSDHPPRAEYALTPKGDTLRPVLRALRDWGLTHGK
jgi:DNA-binding HxlR family transcriptional regulator